MKKTLLLVLMLTSVTTNRVLAQSPIKKMPADLLTSWMQLHCRVLLNASGIAHVAYSRHFSYTSIAVYETIVGSDPFYRSLANQLNGLTEIPRSSKVNIQWPVSLNAAYAEMLRAFYGNFGASKASIDSMEQVQYSILQDPKSSAQSLAQSVAFGKQVAVHVLNWASTDGSVSNKRYVPLTGDGIWSPASHAAEPFWSENRAFIPALDSAFAIDAPVYAKDTMSAFYKMASEVYMVTKHLTTEQKEIALFWDDSPNGKFYTAYGHWASILAGLIKEENMSLIKAAETYTKMAIAMHDAAILAWKGKYMFNVVRPVSYIHQHIDKQWQPLIYTPPHPEFPAAHATLSNAAAVTLSMYFGEHRIVKDNSYQSIGMKERTYTSLREAAREAGMSRLYGGIHYRYSIEEGFELGESVAMLVHRSIIFHISR